MKPPTCPNCGKQLNLVIEKEYSVYRYYWDEKRGIYEPHIGLFQDESELIEILCPRCGEDLSELFKDGVCNYRHE